MFLKSLLLQLTFLNAIFGDICHTEHGTEYGEKGVSMYAESNHGPDGKIFLDPYFKKDIEQLDKEKVLDAGCGAAPWAIYAAQNGGDVYAIDVQDGMIQAAKLAIESAGLEKKICLIKGDVAKLPFQHNFFDKALSICVGCNLPPQTFEKHFLEFFRTVKEGGTVVVGAPTSLDVVFTNGSQTKKETFEHISTILNQLPSNPRPDAIAEKLCELKEVLSATFFMKNQKLTLVTNEKELKEGEAIWRKLPKCVVPNRYYSKGFYAKTLKKIGFAIEEISLPHFADEIERDKYNNNIQIGSKLGPEYVAYSPFVIFHAKKYTQADTKQQLVSK